MDSVGPLQVIKQNNLDADNTGYTGILLYDKVNQKVASTRCKAIGEKLSPAYFRKSDAKDLKLQFDYLLSIKSLEKDDLFWTAGNCSAYAVANKSVVPVPCDSKLPVLCTNTAPPTKDTVSSSVYDPYKISVSLDGEGTTVTGYHDGRSFRFLGIPFADPPLGDLRFTPPHPYTGPKAIDATKPSLACVQGLQKNPLAGGNTTSEDCLYLNVYTPVLPKNGSGNQGTAGKPVAFFIFGGSYTQGNAAVPLYDGGNFASRNDIIIVTANYRLGALGLLTTGGNITTENNSIRDMIKALEWVQDYIALFGGDPSRVTLYGQSAGAQSVTALLTSSAATGLFSAAIAQSLSVSPWLTKELYAELAIPYLAPVVGCNASVPDEELVACLRSVPATMFSPDRQAYSQVLPVIGSNVTKDYLHTPQGLGQFTEFLPVIDASGSGIIEGQFNTMVQEQTLPNRVPALFTTVPNEATLFAADFPSIPGPPSQKVLDEILKLFIPSGALSDPASLEVFRINTSDPDGNIQGALNYLTDYIFHCPVPDILAHGGATSFPSLYFAEIANGNLPFTPFKPERCLPNNINNETCHTADLPLAWGTLNTVTKEIQPYSGESNVEHAQLIHDIFSSFIRTHNPNPDPKYLKLRSYDASYNVFGKDNYKIAPFDPESAAINSLTMPPAYTGNPLKTTECAIYDKYGFIYSHIN